VRRRCPRLAQGRRALAGRLQAKVTPLLIARLGYAHRGRSRPGQGVSGPAWALRLSGATPSITQCSSAARLSKRPVAGPPPQWFMPGTGNTRTKAAARPLLKVKLGREGDPARIGAVRRAAPQAQLIVDANEGWNETNLEANLAACAAAGVTLVEQPLPDGRDALLGRIARAIPVCADESAHARDSLHTLAGKYDAVNVKLDKAGGLTEALAMAAEAERLGLKLMVGCMVATSLSMAPALLVAQRAAVVDLDGPLLLAQDRPEALRYEGSLVHPPAAALWG